MLYAKMRSFAKFKIFQVRYMGIAYIMYAFKSGNVLCADTQSFLKISINMLRMSLNLYHACFC